MIAASLIKYGSERCLKVDLVFEGGGVTGISYVGAVKALEEREYKIHRCAGTSAGSIMAALIMAGYTSEEMIAILNKTDFKKFLKKTNVCKLPLVGKPFSIICEKGLYNSEVIEEWVQELLSKKGITKFKHVMADGESKLKIIAADITRRRMLVLPENLSDYGVDPYEFSIAKAVRMSCAIPFFFTPYILSSKGRKNFIVDGGLLSGFPVWIFDIEGTPKWPTFGIKIKDLDSNTLRGKTDIVSYVKDIMTAPINQDVENYIRDKDLIRTIVIDYDGKVGATGFDKANDFTASFYERGYNSTVKFINSWDYRKYIRTFSG